MIVSLFDWSGEKIHTLQLPTANPTGIIIWRGRYFRLDNGRYIESSVMHAGNVMHAG